MTNLEKLQLIFDEFTNIQDIFARAIILKKYFVPQYELNCNLGVNKVTLFARGFGEFDNAIEFYYGEHEKAYWYESVFCAKRDKNCQIMDLDDAEAIYDAMTLDFVQLYNEMRYKENCKILKEVEKKLDTIPFVQHLFPLSHATEEEIKNYVQKINDLVSFN